MNASVNISEIQIVPIRPSSGLVGFASAVINQQFYIGNIAIYTAPNSPGGFRLVYPTKKLASGKQVHCFYPISRNVAEVVTAAIIKRYVCLMENFENVTA